MSTPPTVSKRQRKDVVDALRIGSVPRKGLHLYATGVERFERVIDEELADVAAGRSRFKAIRAPYGGGKTFFCRWLEARALQQGFAVAEVQISTDTPLHQLQTVYRRAMERLSTRDRDGAAFRNVVDGWTFTLEEELRAAGTLRPEAGEAEVKTKVGEALEGRLKSLSAQNHHFAAVLRAYHAAVVSQDEPTAQGLIAWVSGVEGIAQAVKKKAAITGSIDHRMAIGFFQGLLSVLRESGRTGLVLVLDEVETIQRQRRDTREKSLQGLRELVDLCAMSQLPGLYLVVTGTPEFFDSPWGMQRLEPLKQRLETRFDADTRFDNLKAPQIRLLTFDTARLVEVGRRVRDAYPAGDEERLRRVVDDNFLRALVEAVVGVLGGQVGVAPRLFLRKLVDVLDRVDQYADYDPAKHYKIEVKDDELGEEERVAAGRASAPRTPDDLDLPIDDT